MDREAWHASIHGVTKSQTRLSNGTELIPGSSTVTNVLVWWGMLTIWELCIYRAESIWDISVPSPQFFCEKNCLKKKNEVKKKIRIVKLLR